MSHGDGLRKRDRRLFAPRAARLCAGFLFLLAPCLAEEPTTQPIALRIIVVNSASEAQKVLDRLKRGEDFAAVANAVSTDATAADGGYMGQLDPLTLRSAIRDGIKGVAPGQLTPVI